MRTGFYGMNRHSKYFTIDGFVRKGKPFIRNDIEWFILNMEGRSERNQVTSARPVTIIFSSLSMEMSFLSKSPTFSPWLSMMNRSAIE
jgi:hypothetical protein